MLGAERVGHDAARSAMALDLQEPQRQKPVAGVRDASPKRACSPDFCSLPLALRGRGACRMLTKSGVLQPGSRAAQNSRTAADTPGAFTTTNASERSPSTGQGRARFHLAGIVQTVRDTLRLKVAHEDLTTYNAVQKLLYIVVILAGLTDGHI